MASESTPEWPDDEVLPAIHPEGLEPSGGTTPAEEPSKIAADPTHGISSNGNGYHAKSDAVSGKKAGGDKKRGTSPREGGGTQKGGKARGASKQKGGGHERSASSGSLNGRQGEAVAAGSEEGKKSSSWKDRKVLIVFEVDMGDGRIEKIELREGQKLRPGVRAFCRNHGLDIDTTAPRLEAHLREKAPPGIIPPEKGDVQQQHQQGKGGGKGKGGGNGSQHKSAKQTKDTKQGGGGKGGKGAKEEAGSGRKHQHQHQEA